MNFFHFTNKFQVNFYVKLVHLIYKIIILSTQQNSKKDFMNIFKKPSLKATKKFLATLLCSSLVLGTLGVNAVSISFDDIEQVEEASLKETESNISFEELEETETSVSENTETVSGNNILELNEADSYIDEYYFPEATEENIQTLSLDSYAEQQIYSTRSTTESQYAYFTKATNVTYSGQVAGPTSETHSQWKALQFVGYNNTEVDLTKYVVFENAVKSSDKNYDLVIYPYKGNFNAQVVISNGYEPKAPCIRCPFGKYNCYRLVVTEHGNINNAIQVKCTFGISDLDGGTTYEYIIMPSNFSEKHVGSYLNKTNVTSPITGIKYKGTKTLSTKNHIFNNGCVIGTIQIPKEGVTIAYGIEGTYAGNDVSHAARASMAFDGIKDYWGDDIIEPEIEYTIQFNANGGTGSIPSAITKSGTDSSVVMGDIGSSKPTRSGYEFRGWSASSSWSTSNKRIAYSGISGATTTSSSWSYATYCTNTGGSSSSNTLTLYAQWEAIPQYSHTLSYNANGGTNAPSSSTVTNTSSTYSMTVSSSQPTRTGYTFAGWNTNSSGTGTNYSAGNSVSVGANATVTLYAKWTPITYSITYNGNGNTGGSTASQTKTYNVAINLQNNGFTKTGYHFTGWNTASNGTGTSYSAGASYNSNANLALYAQWAINSSTLKVNPNGGSWNNSTTTQSFTQNYNTTKSIPVPTRTGYTFTTWTRSGTNGSMSSLTGSATYTFGASNGVTDTLTAGWSVNNYTVTYIDRITGTTTQLGTTSTASKPYGSTVRGADKGSNVTVGAYYTGYYYASDTSTTVSTSGATVYRYFTPQNYTVTYIDVIDSKTGKEFGRSTASKPFNSTVRGADKGSSTTDNAYYNGYYYVSDTSATVTTSGATVYRIFKQRMNTIAGNIIWEDWNNKNLSRPENVNLYIKGSDGKTYSYVITGNHSQNTSVNSWPYSYDLPKYDSNGNVIVYTVSQDKAISQEEGLYYQEPIVNGYNITNKATNKPIGGIDPYPTKVTITITWDDENDFYGFRPENATIQLLRNGEVIKTADVSDSYTFTDLLKYDENGNKYVYTIQASDEKRYTKVENNSAPYNKTVIYTFVESSFSVLIPKVIVLDGNQGNADYDITVNGAFYYNDTLTVKPANSFTMTDRSNISQMKANILQSKQNFMKSDITSSGAKTTGSIQVDRTHFAGSWTGTFNFDIKFIMQN